MADVIGMADVSTPDTGKGSQLKTGGINRSYNMKNKCTIKQVWNAKLKKCVSKNPAQLKSIERKKGQKVKSKEASQLGKMKKSRTLIHPGGGEDKVWIE